jgi:hypothetical protein
MGYTLFFMVCASRTPQVKAYWVQPANLAPHVRTVLARVDAFVGDYQAGRAAGLVALDTARRRPGYGAAALKVRRKALRLEGRCRAHLRLALSAAAVSASDP